MTKFVCRRIRLYSIEYTIQHGKRLFLCFRVVVCKKKSMFGHHARVERTTTMTTARVRVVVLCLRV